MNENGKKIADFDLAIGGSIFSHKTISLQKNTWVLSDQVTENQIDFIYVIQGNLEGLCWIPGWKEEQM